MDKSSSPVLKRDVRNTSLFCFYEVVLLKVKSNVLIGLHNIMLK